MLFKRSKAQNTMSKRESNLECSSRDIIAVKDANNRERSSSSNRISNINNNNTNELTKLISKNESYLKNQVQILITCISRMQEQCLELEKQASEIRNNQETNSMVYI